MSINKFSKIVAVAVVATLASASVNAATSSDKPSTSKEVKIGMSSGVIAGALIGGPFGAGIGFIVGTVTGAHAEKARATANKAAALEAQLASAKQELNSTQQELASVQVALASAAEKSKQDLPDGSKEDQMLSQLAQRLHADVLFRTASAELDTTSAAKLADLGAVLVNYPGLVIEIDGYADPRGKVGENFELSQQRASAVRAALIVGGAKPESIHVAAHGEQLSTSAKGDMEAYAWERRVSLSVTPATQGQVAQAK